MADGHPVSGWTGIYKVNNSDPILKVFKIFHVASKANSGIWINLGNASV